MSGKKVCMCVYIYVHTHTYMRTYMQESQNPPPPHTKKHHVAKFSGGHRLDEHSGRHLKNEKSAQRGSFWDGHPADIRGSFARISWPKTSVWAVQILEKNQHFGADIHDPKARTSTTLRGFQKLRSRRTNPNSCSTGPALWEFFRKSAVLQGKRPWRTGEKVAKIQILLCLP